LTSFAVAIFALVYAGMAAGRIPGLAVDRTGIALLGLIALLATDELTIAEAGNAIDFPTLILLFALMIVSAQFEQSGFYAWVAQRIVRATSSPRRLLATIIAVTGGLSALLTNDVVVLALTPLLCRALLASRLDARPYLIGAAAAANAGSAATLIGNPQNILIGQAGSVDFWKYVFYAGPPALLALVFVYLGVVLAFPLQPASKKPDTEPVRIQRVQLAKAVIAIAALVGLFLTPLHREISALAIAGLLLLSRRLSSREMIGAVDWHLLLLFVCLFGITDVFARTGVAQDALTWLAEQNLVADRLSVMAPLALATSNTIGNVPTVILLMKLLPGLQEGALMGLAMLSTLAGNLLLTGSLCNIIVAEKSAEQGVRLGFAEFAKAGIPITLWSMAAAVAWIWVNRLMVV
jgi:Na+/H+ antiporter NhaD/arsenite permease-like protein